MEQINVKISRNKDTSYPILIGDNLLDNAYHYFKQVTNANRFLIVTNDKVYSLFGDKLKNNMSFSTFILCLDWLYLIDSVKVIERGDVEICLLKD